jgi:hypothetical protein
MSSCNFRMFNLEISHQEMDGNGSGFFRLKYKKADFAIQGAGRESGPQQYLTFLAKQPTPTSPLETDTGQGPSAGGSAKKPGHKSSIYVLTQVHQHDGKISVQRTNLSLKEWLIELERRRG